MSERAYSFELCKNISAKEAVELSEKERLSNERAFCCCDKKCGILLTCTNWKNTSGKRFYFVPSHNDELHVIGCDEVGKKEERQQIEKEIKEISEEVKNNGIITMMVSPDKNTKEVEMGQDVEKIPSKETGYSYKRENENRGSKYEGRRAARIEAFVELFNNGKVDRNIEVICVKGKMYSLNELFSSSNKVPEDGAFGIFYGDAKIKKCGFNKDMIEITYLNSSLPSIYTNIDSLKKISNGAKAMKYINTNKSVKTYFRGIYKTKKGKFEPYNDKYFRDLYFEIE